LRRWPGLRVAVGRIEAGGGVSSVSDAVDVVEYVHVSVRAEDHTAGRNRCRSVPPGDTTRVEVVHVLVTRLIEPAPTDHVMPGTTNAQIATSNTTTAITRQSRRRGGNREPQAARDSRFQCSEPRRRTIDDTLPLRAKDIHCSRVLVIANAAKTASAREPSSVAR
jgi:hypothetical protein